MVGLSQQSSAPETTQALNTLAGLLLADENPQSVLQRVVDLVQQVMPTGAEASLTVRRNKRATTAAFTGDLALLLDEEQYSQGHGPCLEAAVSGQFVEITDGRIESRWPAYMPIFLQHGARSSLGVPVPVAELVAALNVYSPVADAFTDTHKRTAAQFAAYAAVVLTNMNTLQDARDVADNLRTALLSRAAIEQAKGILMERYKVTGEEAFRLLVDFSMRANRKVRDLAEDLVLTGELMR